jgi:hypothetical protein
MADLSQIHQALVEDYRESFVIAAGQLLAQPSWNFPYGWNTSRLSSMSSCDYRSRG